MKSARNRRAGYLFPYGSLHDFFFAQRYLYQSATVKAPDPYIKLKLFYPSSCSYLPCPFRPTSGDGPLLSLALGCSAIPIFSHNPALQLSNNSFIQLPSTPSIDCAISFSPGTMTDNITKVILP